MTGLGAIQQLAQGVDSKGLDRRQGRKMREVNQGRLAKSLSCGNSMHQAWRMNGRLGMGDRCKG